MSDRPLVVSAAHRDAADAAWADVRSDLRLVAPYMSAFGVNPAHWSDIEGFTLAVDGIELLHGGYDNRFETAIEDLRDACRRIADAMEACHDECGCLECAETRALYGPCR